MWMLVCVLATPLPRQLPVAACESGRGGSTPSAAACAGGTPSSSSLAASDQPGSEPSDHSGSDPEEERSLSLSFCTYDFEAVFFKESKCKDRIGNSKICKQKTEAWGSLLASSSEMRRQLTMVFESDKNLTLPWRNELLNPYILHHRNDGKFIKEIK